MEEGTIGEFEKSFRFLQEVYSKKDVPAEYVSKDVHVAMSVYADLTKILPGMLPALKSEIKRNIGPEQSTGESRLKPHSQCKRSARKHNTLNKHLNMR